MTTDNPRERLDLDRVSNDLVAQVRHAVAALEEHAVAMYDRVKTGVQHAGRLELEV
jgi:hypothetical protein